MKQTSTDAFPWLVESAMLFENLGENDNAIKATIDAIDLAAKVNQINKGYEIFRYARSMFENGIRENHQSLSNPDLKQKLIRSGQNLIAVARETAIGSPMADVQAELKASILSGVSLKKVDEEVEKEEAERLVISHGRSLYTKKSNEYKEGADTYLASGMVQNAVVFACLGALADLMLGPPEEGLRFLSEFTKHSGKKEEFLANPCFQWTKLVFAGLVKRDLNSIEQARTRFVKLQWSFKDDMEFARRIMESVHRRISQ
ncbi:MAG: hypothetical protein JSW05_05895 [Candidatus Thorarchaeota archaeon]|nr:MAG: hypothetical protein JSW05_05895 [Candidatus Thorarchaeota archaeon]